MARIRIVDEWLRSPVSAPTRRRTIMVVSRCWSEQRVLMRAFSACADQTQPTIALLGHELAIGPAGLDPHGEWGIHVESSEEGRAQQCREALERVAKLLAGSQRTSSSTKEGQLEEKTTQVFVPGAPSPRGADTGHGDEATAFPGPPSVLSGVGRRTAPFGGAIPGEQALGKGGRSKGGVTRHGFLPDSEAAVSSRGSYVSIASQTLPLGFSLGAQERQILQALSKVRSMGAPEVGRILNISDPQLWMRAFMAKLSDFGLDLLEVEESGGVSMYTLVG